MIDRLVETTGAEEESAINASRDVFFNGILERVGLAQPNPFIEVKTLQTGREEPGSKIYPDDGHIDLLVVRDETVAIVLSRRIDMNWIEATFFERAPSERLAAWLVNLALHAGMNRETATQD